ncbi:MAG: hypothetical protein ACO1SV_25370 [Fimbriimonas sp.]
MARRRQFSSSYSSSKERFPWVLFLVLLATAYLFWGLPRQQGPRPIKVEFAEKK